MWSSQNVHNLKQLCTFLTPNSSCRLSLSTPTSFLLNVHTCTLEFRKLTSSRCSHADAAFSTLLPGSLSVSLINILLSHETINPAFSLLSCKNIMKITIIVHDYYMNFKSVSLLVHKKLSSIAVINTYAIQQRLNFQF